jgi:S-adenosylmethionine synthetase
MQIQFETAPGPGLASEQVEIVERKGLGHPDSICDQAMDQVSVGLCRAYRERFGAILHHNCDKGLLVAGAVEHRLGGGFVSEPMGLVLGDRATSGPRMPAAEVAEVAVEAVKTWIRGHLRHVDPDRHVRFQVELRSGSRQLMDVFRESQRRVLGANDTSAAVGYAPLTDTERLVLETERFLNGPAFKGRFPFTGEDVKVMGMRRGRALDLTVAMPFLDCAIASEAQYFQAKEETIAALHSHLAEHGRGLESISIALNALDQRGAGLDGMYLSVLGTSAEDADSGEVGRGNRVNGLIPFFRPGSTEAAAGKNPVSHVGKIYNVLSHLLAGEIHRGVAGVEEVTVWLLSRIGDPVDAPRLVAVRPRLGPGIHLAEIQRPVTRLIEKELERLPALCEELAQGKHPLC